MFLMPMFGNYIRIRLYRSFQTEETGLGKRNTVLERGSEIVVESQIRAAEHPQTPHFP